MKISGTILIIDDEASLRQTLARIFQRANLSVTTAGSANEGLILLSRQAFNLVYLDIRMPDMSGLEALKIIHSKYPAVPVIIFTAQPDLNSAVEALRHGAVDYLIKPLQPKILIDRTQTVLAAQEKERRKREVEMQIEALQTDLKLLEGKPGIHPGQTPKDAPPNERFLTRGKLSLDLHTHRLLVENQTINLPPTAFNYLLVLVRHAPDVVDYQTLVTEAQGYQIELREARELVKWYIHEVRQAIEPDVRNPSYLINVRGTGYRLVTD
jgi:DNA-binding response OmpR family regulator